MFDGTITIPIIHFLQNLFREPDWEVVRSILSDLTKSGERALLCRINWGEFYHIVRQRLGKVKADESLLLIEQLPVGITSVDDQFVREAAEIKADYPVAFADAFCITTAIRING